jgi:cytochrome c553
MHLTHHSLLFMALTFFLSAHPTDAKANEHMRAKALAAGCKGCHGEHGEGQGSLPALTGLTQDEFMRRMEGYRLDEQSNSVMHRIAKHYDHEDVRLLAKAFTGDSAP